MWLWDGFGEALRRLGRLWEERGRPTAAMRAQRAAACALALLCAAAPVVRGVNVTYTQVLTKANTDAKKCAAADGISNRVDAPLGVCVPTEPLGQGVDSYDEYPYVRPSNPSTTAAAACL